MDAGPSSIKTNHCILGDGKFFFLERTYFMSSRVLFSIFSKRLINLRPACCHLALSREAE